MAPALEEELASQIVRSGEEHDREYIADRIRLLREQGFPISERAVETALERFDLIRRYHSQKVKPREVRKAQWGILCKIGNQKIEELEQDPLVVSARLIYDLDCSYKCYMCGTRARGKFEIRYDCLVDVAGKLIRRRNNKLEGSYCFACKRVLR